MTTNRLAILVADIRAAHEDVCQAQHYAALRAVDAGRALFEAKSSDEIPQGDWRRWVEEVAGVPYSSAQRYISLFIAIEEGSLTVEDIAEEGQKAALKLGAAADTARRRMESRNAEPLPDGMELRIGDARIVLADVAPNSVPLILTDPPALHADAPRRRDDKQDNR